MALQLPDLARGISTLARFQRDFEASFVEIARVLPRVATDVPELVTMLRELAEPQSAESLTRTARDTANVALAFDDFIATMVGLNRELSAATPELLEATSSLATALVGIDRLASRLLPIGLNAAFAASELGGEGRALAVITRELVGLTGTSSRLAKGIDQTARSVRLELEALRELQGAVETELIALTKETRSSVDAVLDRSGSLLAELAGVARRTEQKLGTTQKPLTDAMDVLQRQDILREGIDHVAKALAELDAAQTKTIGRGNGAEAALVSFARDAGEQSVAVLNDVDRELKRLESELSEQLGVVRSCTGPIGDLEERFRQSTSDDVHVAAPLAVLEKAQQKLEQSSVLFARYGKLSVELKTLPVRMARALAELENIDSELATIKVLMKLESARSVRFHRVVTIVDDVVAAKNTFTKFAESVATILGDLPGLIAKLDATIGRVSASHRKGLEAVRSAVADHRQRLTRAEQTFRDELQMVQAVASRLTGGVNECERQMATVRNGFSACEQIRGTCTQAADAARARSFALANVAPDDEPAFRAIVERFAQLSLRRITGPSGMVPGHDEASVSLF